MAKRTYRGDVANAFVRCILDDIAAMYGGYPDKAQMKETMEFFENKDPYSGEDLPKDKDLEYDHIIPNNKDYCGLGIMGNVVKTSAKNNREKGSKNYIEFIKEKVANKEQAQKIISKIKEFQKKSKYEKNIIENKKMEEIKVLCQKKYDEINDDLKKLKKECMEILGVEFDTSKLKEPNNTYTVLNYLEYKDIDTDEIRENYKIFRISDNGVYKPSTPPSLEWLKQDWWLILNDTKNCKIHVFCIQANKISEDKIKNNIGKRDDKDVINFNIYKEKDGIFCDKKSSICFNKWLEKSLDY